MKAFTKTAAALSFVLALAMVRPAAAETTQHYAFVGASLGNDYVEMARNVKDSSEIADIRSQILRSESLSKEEKVSLIQQVSDVQQEKIQSEYITERNWIWAEAAASAIIRGVNLGFNKNPASAAAIDEFAEKVLQGEFRAAIVDGCQKGDWSGLEEVAQSVGANWVFGKGMDLFGKIPAIQKASGALVERIGAQVEKLPGFRNKLGEYAMMESNLYDDLNRTLTPKLNAVKGEMAEVYRGIARAGSDAEKSALTKSLSLLENEAAQLQNQIVRKQAEIAAAERLFLAYEYNIKSSVAHIGDNIQSLLVDSDWVTDVAQSIDGMIIKIGDKVTESVVTAQMAIAEKAFDLAEREYRERVAAIERGEADGEPLVLHGGVSVDVYPDGEGGHGGQGDSNGGGVNGDLVRDRTNDGLRPGTEQDPSTYGGRNDGGDARARTVLDAIFDALGWSLDEKTAGDITDVIIDVLKNGLPKLEQYEKKIGDLLPGDASKKVMETLLDKVVRGDFDGIETTIRDFGQAVAADYATGLVIDTGLVDGLPVMDIQKAIQELVASGYDAGVSFVEVLQQAIDGGCFGGGGGTSQNTGINSTAPATGFNLPAWLSGKLSGITPAGVWGTIKAKIQTVGLQKLEQFAVKQLNSWINKYPGVKKWLVDIFGIDGQSIVNGVKNIWGVLRGNGTLSEKFEKLVSMAQNALCDMAKNALKYGLGKLKSWISSIANKWISKVVGWISNKIQQWFHIKIPAKFLGKVQSWLNGQVGKGITKVVDVLQDKGEAVIDKFRPKAAGTPEKQVFDLQQMKTTSP
ncbi:MAG: hypothetical protein IK066_11525 [Kiritimatiellae bacterium]|nr:hypothetical protein [Kiritimatiellia bacterium]